MTIPLTCIQQTLAFVAAFGIVLGVFSLVQPAGSIKLYQWIMRRLNWKVEPVNYQQELRNTRVLGFLMMLTSALAIAALVRPAWFLMDWLQAARLAG